MESLNNDNIAPLIIGEAIFIIELELLNIELAAISESFLTTRGTIDLMVGVTKILIVDKKKDIMYISYTFLTKGRNNTAIPLKKATTLPKGKEKTIVRMKIHPYYCHKLNAL